MKVSKAFSEVDKLNVRRATTEDLSSIVKLAVKLAQQHGNYDKRRFDLSIFEPLEKSHTEFLSRQLQNSDAVFLIAEVERRIIGYAFLRLEPRNLGDILDQSIWLHDIYMEDVVRGRGLGKRFFEAIIKEANELGPHSLMLTVSPHNATARKFFTKIGFRQTMQEMRMDFELGGNAQ